MWACGRSIRNSTERRKLGFFFCRTGNPIDDCWRCDSNWHKNRKRPADCGIGFGRNVVGGPDGYFYVVTDPTTMTLPIRSPALCTMLSFSKRRETKQERERASDIWFRLE
jgi:hypothetical protein